MLIVGLGDIFDGDNNTLLGVQAEVSVNFGAESVSVPAGDTSSNIVIQTAQPITGTFAFRSVNGAALVSLTAGTNVLSSGSVDSWRYQKETGTVGTNIITLSDTVDLIAGDVALQVVKRNGVPYKPVTGAPTAGQVQYADASATLTFETGAENGEQFDVTYFTLETAGATRVFTLDPTALPPSRHYVIGMKVYSQYTGAFLSGGVVFDLAKVTRTSEAGPVGATVGDTSQIGFDWEAVNTSSGDVKVYVPTEGVHQ